MVNQSKRNDPRFLRLWTASGAMGSMPPKKQPAPPSTPKPAVAITELPTSGTALSVASGVDLGSFALNQQVERVLSRFRERAAKVLLLQWIGSKIPRTAVIDGQEIGWTQNGMVAGTKGENIGTYVRLVEFGGESGKEHAMLVFVSSQRKNAAVA